MLALKTSYEPTTTLGLFSQRHQPLERMLDSDGQQDGQDAEPVAERDVPRLTQIDRRQSADFDALRPVALLLQVIAHRAGDAGKQHVVDRTAERPARRLDLRQFQRLGPGDALRAVRLALEAGRAVALHGEQVAELPCDARPVAQETRGAQRMTRETK